MGSYGGADAEEEEVEEEEEEDRACGSGADARKARPVELFLPFCVEVV